jgi:hypothetical protein
LQTSSLHGRHLSDRYYLQQLLRGLHPVLSSYVQWLELEASRTNIDLPLPCSFWPERILSRFLQRARHRNQLALVTKSPREVTRAAAPVRSLTSSPSPSTEAAVVAAVAASASAPVCFLCGAPDHLLPACPRLPDLQANPAAARAFTKLFAPTKKVSFRPPASSRSSPSRVRALLSEGPSDDDPDPSDDPDPDPDDSHAADSGPDFQ